MEAKKLLRLIKEDISHLEGITSEFLLDSLPPSDEVEVALVRANALLRELELLHKITVQHEKNSNEDNLIEESEAEIFDEQIVTKSEGNEFTVEQTVEPIIKEEKTTIENVEVSEPEETTSFETTVVPELPDQNEEVVAEDFKEEKKILVETVGESQQIVNDILSVEKNETGYQLIPINSIWDGIGINDRFLFIRELFANSSAKFETTVAALDKLATIQDAVTYLKSNFKWNKTEASQKFLVLVKRRFTK